MKTATRLLLSALLASIASVVVRGQTIVTFGDSLTDSGYGAKYVQNLLNTTDVSGLLTPLYGTALGLKPLAFLVADLH